MQRTMMQRKIAKRFTELLEEELGKEKFQEMRELNREETDPRICRSHDFCDVNMVMLDAYKEVTGEEDIDLNSEKSVKLWENAWNIAKENDFILNDI